MSQDPSNNKPRDDDVRGNDLGNTQSPVNNPEQQQPVVAIPASTMQEAVEAGSTVTSPSTKQPEFGVQPGPIAVDGGGGVGDGGGTTSTSRRGGLTPKINPIRALQRSFSKPDPEDTPLNRLYQDVTARSRRGSERAAAAVAKQAEGTPQGDEEELDKGKAMKRLSVEEALAKFQSDLNNGLSDEEVQRKTEEYGLNELPKIKRSKILKFLSFMWNPLSWVMEAAAIVAIAVANGPEPWLCPKDATGQYLDPSCPTNNDVPDWEDFVGIISLLFVNSAIGYYEETQAGEAVDALMEQLTRQYKVKRNGEWVEKEAKYLVPGDIITVKLGDIVPADCKIVHGEQMKVDQSALTGESLPVSRHVGEILLSGSTIKQGENEAMVYATGVNTVSGKSQTLVASTDEMGHLQLILTQIGSFCLVWIFIWIIVNCAVVYGEYGWDYRRGINLVLVVLIGGVPIAMPTVLSVTMAIGVNELAREQAVVTRITAVEELAGMDVLCTDKTGTLTMNHLTITDTTFVEPYTKEDVLLFAALSSRRTGDPDAIDRCVAECIPPDMNQELNERYKVQRFVPFDPMSKRTEASVIDNKTGEHFLASKGAPQVIINLAHNANEIREKQEKIINDYAVRGLRGLGVARSDDEGKSWHFMGLLALSDPPRPDTRDTIQAAMFLGVRVVMITGDQVAIGKEIARLLGMGLNFYSAQVLNQSSLGGIPTADMIESANGWGEVMPEHKYNVVQGFRANHHLVGMTGDGVNDAPALKVADVGIAVADATDAARNAADMVLLTDGLSVIIKAILGSRCIFQRMRNYATYACTTTIRIVTTFSLLACVWQFSFPPFLVLIIALLNDGTIMTVSTDRVEPSPHPDKWRLRDIFVAAFVLGFYLTASSLIFFWLITGTTFFEDRFGAFPLKYNVSNPINIEAFTLSGVMYLQVSITGQLIIFTTRARTFFFLNRPSILLMLAGVVAQLAATFIAVYANASWTQLYPIGWGWAAIVWVWSLIWLAPMDFPKMFVNMMLEGGRPSVKMFRFPTIIDRVFHPQQQRYPSVSGAGSASPRPPPGLQMSRRNSFSGQIK